VSWGPLALTTPSFNSGTGFTGTGNYGSGPSLANYNLTVAIDTIPANQPHPFTDFYGNLRPEPGESTGGSGRFDPGAIEFGSTMGTASFSVSPSTLSFGPEALATSSAAQTVTVTNTGSLPLTGGPSGTGSASFTGSGCTTTLAVGGTCTYAVSFRPTAVTSYTGTVTFTYTATVGTTTVPATGTGNPVSLSGSGVAAGPLAFTAATFTCPTGTTCTGGSLTTVGGARTLTFPTNSTRTGPITALVTITNTGTAANAPTPVTITGETAAGIGNGAGLFTLNGTTCGATLAAGGTCTITLRYAIPTAPPPPPARAVTGLAAVANNGSGANGGSTNLGLVGR